MYFRVGVVDETGNEVKFWFEHEKKVSFLKHAASEYPTVKQLSEKFKKNQNSDT